MSERENEKTIEAICRRFQLEGEYRGAEIVTCGHINSTYKVRFFRDGEEKPYILQKVNTYVFKNPVQVMENILSVTEHIRRKIKSTGVTAKRLVLHYQTTEDGTCYQYDENGGFWRCYRYIDGSAAFTEATEAIMQEAGRAFGEFQRNLADYPVESLHIVIPHFHNTEMRFAALKEAAKNDFSRRAESVQEELNRYFSLEEIATRAYRLQKAGKLPLRVTHNDTKCSNVLFDEKTNEHLAVIDLDTVMPGLVAFDFGDAVRAGASTAAEDEVELSKVRLDLNKFELFAKGFLTEVRPIVSENEKTAMSLGAIAMTLECGARFLTDYLDGDKYFRVAYPEHNLVRARNQLRLGEDMIAHLSEMDEIVKKYV